MGEFFHSTWGLERKQGPRIWGIIAFFFYSKANAPYFPGVGVSIDRCINRKVGGLSPPGNCYFCVLEISKQSQQVSTNREAENAGRDHIMQVSKATVVVILVMCLLPVYERRSCLPTKPRIQRLIGWTMTPVNSQSSVNGKNSHVTPVKDLRRLEITFWGARLGGERLDSDVSMHRAYCK